MDSSRIQNSRNSATAAWVIFESINPERYPVVIDYSKDDYTVAFTFTKSDQGINMRASVSEISHRDNVPF